MSLHPTAKPSVRDAAPQHRGPVEGVWGNREVPPMEVHA
jgi:hypothetical protein